MAMTNAQKQAAYRRRKAVRDAELVTSLAAELVRAHGNLKEQGNRSMNTYNLVTRLPADQKWRVMDPDWYIENGLSLLHDFQIVDGMPNYEVIRGATGAFILRYGQWLSRMGGLVPDGKNLKDVLTEEDMRRLWGETCATD
jgi:hypothetical protein